MDAEGARAVGDILIYTHGKGIRLLEHHPHVAAQIVDVDFSVYIHIADFELTLDGIVAGATPTLSDLKGYGSVDYSFYVELYNAAGDSVYKTQAVSYNSLLSSGYIATGGVLTPAVLATGGFNGAAVPEPTSGVLLLIGGAMLALRRRRRM